MKLKDPKAPTKSMKDVILLMRNGWYILPPNHCCNRSKMYMLRHPRFSNRSDFKMVNKTTMDKLKAGGFVQIGSLKLAEVVAAQMKGGA